MKSPTSLTIEKGNLILRTPYDAALVADLKSTIPLHGRAWNPQRRVWEIAYMYGQDVVDIVRDNLGTELAASIAKAISEGILGFKPEGITNENNTSM